MDVFLIGLEAILTPDWYFVRFMIASAGPEDPIRILVFTFTILGIVLGGYFVGRWCYDHRLHAMAMFVVGVVGGIVLGFLGFALMASLSMQCLTSYTTTKSIENAFAPLNSLIKFGLVVIAFLAPICPVAIYYFALRGNPNFLISSIIVIFGLSLQIGLCAGIGHRIFEERYPESWWSRFYRKC